MFTPASKVLIWATDDGIVLQARARQTQPVVERVKISYKSHGVVRDDQPLASSTAPFNALTAYGIVGLLRVSSAAYLLVITQRERVAEINSKAIYVVKDVSVISLTSRNDAEDGIHKAIETQRKGAGLDVQSDDSPDEACRDDEGAIGDDDDEETDDDVVTEYSDTQDDNKGNLAEASPPVRQRRTSIAEDVIGKKGRYGRFVERWLSRKGWSVEGRRMQGMSVEEASDDADSVPDVNKPEVVSPRQADGDERLPAQEGESPRQSSSISPDLSIKLLRTIHTLFASRSYFFSYDHDITRRIGSGLPTTDGTALHEVVDPLFFWNRLLLHPFIAGKHHVFVLPLLQGFVGQHSFTAHTVPETTSEESAPTSTAQVDGAAHSIVRRNKFKIASNADTSEAREYVVTLISRRSVKRSGLRYVRRGLDREGDAANTVETEQILSRACPDTPGNTYSFVLLRGSIPLLFSQSPYFFKPVPVLHGSEKSNYDTLKKHFDGLASRYGGDIEAVSLVDRQGNEAEIGRAYEEYMSRLKYRQDEITAECKLGFTWFDFHHVCRGMKFENVRQLLDILEERLDDFGFTVVDSDRDTILHRQSGLVRVNCMDCLDRTNVAQSVLARAMLKVQLQLEGRSIDGSTTTTTTSSTGRAGGHWFDILWADNGDAISREYSSTAALKGDFTRHGRRDYRGVLNDARLTVLRYYHNVVNDHFTQAVIDLMLGNVDDRVFEEFERDFMSRDPLSGMGVAAVLDGDAGAGSSIVDALVQAVVAGPAEKVLGAWLFLCPHDSTSLRSLPMKETICILTTTAIYSCALDDLTLSNHGKANNPSSGDNLPSSPPPAAPIPSLKKVKLQSISALQYGVYITSTFTASSTDEERNVGFAIRYHDTEERQNQTAPRSMAFKYLSASSFASSSASTPAPSPSSFSLSQDSTRKETSPLEFIEGVCRAVQTAATKSGTLSENDVPSKNHPRAGLNESVPFNPVPSNPVIEERSMTTATDNPATEPNNTIPSATINSGRKEIELVKKDVLSLASARQGTGIVEWGVYRVKRYIWAS